MRAEVTEHGTRLTLDAHAIGMRLAGIGRGTLRSVGGEAPRTLGPRTVVEHGDGIVEWWEPRIVGIEHGVTLHERPPGEGVIEVALALSGDVVPSLDDDDVRLHTSLGATIGHYRDLVVRDQDGTSLPARMAVVDGRIHLRFDDRSARYPVVVDPLIVTEEAAMTLSAPELADRMGASVAVTNDARLLLAGATGDGGVGSASVYARGAGGWALQTTLVPTGLTGGAAAGSAVALSAMGDVALVGVSNETVTGVRAGTVRVFDRSGTTWTETATLQAASPGNEDRFGAAVALSEDGRTALIGVPGDQLPTSSGFGPIGQGSARVFRFSGSAWAEEAMLVDTTPVNASDSFGAAVALSADGGRAVVGAPSEDDDRTNGGTARVYSRSGAGTWSLEATLTIPVAEATADDRFGTAVAISADGMRAAVGAPGADPSGTDAGGVWVFVRSGTSWTLEASLSAPSSVPRDRLGAALGVSDDGARIVAGAPGTFDVTGPVGRAVVFVRTGSSWAYDGEFAPPDAVAGDFWGGSATAVSGDGSRAVLGNGDDGVRVGPSDVFGAGSVRVFTLEPQRTDGAACRVAADCVSGNCVDGVCCDTACGGGATDDCMACSIAAGAGADGTCGPLGPSAAPGVVCRAAAGDCDVEEHCVSGAMACPADVGTSDTSRVCRPVAGPCDVAERCSGGPTCPADAKASATTVCRPSIGSCDIAEVCDGTTDACPGDALAAPGAACGMGIGDCGTPANCTGDSPLCPSTGVRPAGHVCRPAGGECDVDELCDGLSSLCPTDAKVDAGTTCRPSSGEVCDAPDACDGIRNDCPATFLSGVVCRASAGACDDEEVCSGSSETCPPDSLAAGGTVCRASADLACDPAESCDGVAATCPRDERTCTDAGRPDGGGGGDVEPAPMPVGGCACAGRAASTPPGVLAVLVLVFALARRRT